MWYSTIKGVQLAASASGLYCTPSSPVGTRSQRAPRKHGIVTDRWARMPFSSVRTTTSVMNSQRTPSRRDTYWASDLAAECHMGGGGGVHDSIISILFFFSYNEICFMRIERKFRFFFEPTHLDLKLIRMLVFIANFFSGRRRIHR